MKNPRISYIIIYIAEIILGLLMLLFTEKIFYYISIIIGCVIVLFGVIKAIISIKLQQKNQKTIYNQMDMIVGILLIFAGIFALIMYNKITTMLPILFGAYIILISILSLSTTFHLKNIHLTKWWIFLITSLIYIIGGGFIIYNPWRNLNINIKIIGILLIIIGITDIITLFLLYLGQKNEDDKQFQNPKLNND